MIYGLDIAATSAWLSPAYVTSWFDEYPGLKELLLIFAALAIFGIMVRYARGATTVANGFIITVDPDDITFKGQFPQQMQRMVTEFLRNDVAIAAAYEIRGHWEDRMLVVVVKGEAARPMEQRIRNFLKLNVKRPT